MFDDLETDILVGLGLDRFRDPSSIVDEVIEERENPKKGIEAPWSKLHGLFEIPQQGITLFGGYSGHSKSTVINQWALHAAASGHKVAIASLELTNAHLYEMLSSQAACVAKPPDSYLKEWAAWADGKLHIVDSHDVLKPEEVLEMVRDSKRLLGCSLFILDCLFQVDLGGELEHEKHFFQQLAATARDFEMAVVVVHHCRKPSGPEGEAKPPAKESFIGSSHLVNAAAAVVVLHEDKKKAMARNAGEEVDDQYGDFTISVLKSRFSPWEGRLPLFKHNSARLLCNSRLRQYRPIDLREDKECQLEKRQSGESAQVTTLNGSGRNERHDSMPKIGTTSTSTASPLWPS
jgi:RecA-family ATPase